MGSKIAVLAGLALLMGLGFWAALPNAAPTSRNDRIGGAPLGSPQPLGVPHLPTAQLPKVAPPAAEVAPRPSDDVSRRVDACVAAQKDVATRRQARQGPPPPGEPSDAAVVAKACAPLFAQPGCREAHVSFDTPPAEARVPTLFRACVREYCPGLPAPKPSACDKMPADGIETFAAWSELRMAILKHDIGEAEAARAFPR
jgi:hypothetical protein